MLQSAAGDAEGPRARGPTQGFCRPLRVRSERERRECGEVRSSPGTDTRRGQAPVPGRAPGAQAPLCKASAGTRGTDRQYLTVVLVLQRLHVSPPGS